MRECVKKYGGELYRGALSLFVLLVAIGTRGETARIAPFAFVMILLLCVGLFCLPRTRYLNFLFLQLSLLLIFCYDSFSVFIKFVWMVPVAVVALGFHLWRLRPRLRIGPTLLPLLAVTVATLLGGIGKIPAADYWRPASLGFMAGLGPGLIFSYWVVKNESVDEADEKGLLDDLFWWGLTASLVVFAYTLPRLLHEHELTNLQWSNNVSTMMMIAMPAVAAKVKKHPVLWPFLLFLPVAMTISSSRAGLLFAWVEFGICALWLLLAERRWCYRLLHALVLFGVVVLGLRVAWPRFQVLLGKSTYFLTLYNPRETRWRLLQRGWEDFLDNPLFGSGLGYRGNADLYNGKLGTIHWYHIFPAQVLGGLGILGVLAWGWQLATRFLLAVRARKSDTFALSLCYLGLWMMSMVNPGEFSPVPYAFVAVQFFAVTENRILGADHRYLFLPTRRRRKKDLLAEAEE